MRFPKFFWALCLILIALPALAQDWIVTGPFGKPVSVWSDPDGWVIPIKAYEDQDVEVDLPDITSERWKHTFGPQYISEGTYILHVFTHYKSNKFCLKYMYPNQNSDPKVQELCEIYGYKVEEMQVNVRTSTVKTLRVIRMERDASSMDPRNVDLTEQDWPIARLDRWTAVAVKSANLILAQEMSARYSQPR